MIGPVQNAFHKVHSLHPLTEFLGLTYELVPGRNISASLRTCGDPNTKAHVATGRDHLPDSQHTTHASPDGAGALHFHHKPLGCHLRENLDCQRQSIRSPVGLTIGVPNKARCDREAIAEGC